MDKKYQDILFRYLKYFVRGCIHTQTHREIL